MTLEEKLLIAAVRASVAGTAQLPEGEPAWSDFLTLAGKHGLLAMAYDGLQKLGAVLPEQVSTYLQRAYMKAIFSDTQTAFLKEQLQAALEAAGVPHIFLKGAVLKAAYPVPALRTMCDVDVLVYTDDYPKIAQVAQSLGGKPGHSDGNHRNYSFPGGVEVEFHPNLLHHATPVGTQINPGWQYAKQGTAGYCRELTEEGFYLNTICHLANHFVDGGVGVRFVLDVWVNRHLRQPAFDRAAVERELERFGMLEFTRKIEELAEVWFGSGEMTELMEELGAYILSSGSHGTADRAVLNAVSLSPGGSSGSALWGKVFFPRQELEDRFPWCKGKPVLLPAAWCVRAFRAVTRHGNLIVQWSKGAGQVSGEEAAKQKEKLKRFGIHKDQ